MSLVACDTSLSEDTAGLMGAASAAGGAAASSSSSGQPPLSLLVHAGGVLADSTVANQSLGLVRKVMAPKLASAARVAPWAELLPTAMQVRPIMRPPTMLKGHSFRRAR